MFQRSSFINTFRYFIKSIFAFSSFNCDISMLRYTIGIEECPCQINDFFSAPVHNQTWVIRNLSYNCGFQVFFISMFNKIIKIFGFNYDGHTFLRFRNRQFRTVKPFIFFRNFIKIYDQTVSQFTNSNGNAACTEVITALNHRRNSRIAEQTLDFTFCRRITFLYLSTTGKQRIYSMFFRRTGCAATAITSGPAAQ